MTALLDYFRLMAYFAVTLFAWGAAGYMPHHRVIPRLVGLWALVGGFGLLATLAGQIDLNALILRFGVALVLWVLAFCIAQAVWIESRRRK
ncbi:MAG: hypothetical protein WCF84_02215 [Anaerolineae bacterium]